MNYRYEVLALTVPEITQDEVKSLESEIERLVRAAKGTVISYERWGKYRLVYPVKKNEYGVYFLARFEAPNGQIVNDIKSYFVIKASDVVMRNIITRLDDTKPLTYQRPKSLEEAPTTSSRDVPSFLKENQMEGMLSTADKHADVDMMGDDEEIESANA
jgi:small subunit ribosomal protein S6